MTAPHRMRPDGFDGLATGRGDPATIAVLRAGQLSRTMLLLGEIVRTVGPDRAGPWTALLTEAQNRDPGAVAEVLGYPAVGAWAARCLARLRSDGAAEPDRFAGIAVAAAVRAGIDFDLVVPAVDGELWLPTLGLQPTSQAVRLTPGALAETQAWQRPHVIRVDHPRVPVEVILDDLDHSTRGTGLPPVHRLDPESVAAWRSAFAAGWFLLADHHPEYAGGLAQGLRSIVPFESTKDGDGISATARDAFGAIGMTPAGDAQGWAATLIHEFQHSKLNALMHLFPLLQGDDAAVLYSPWRADPRSPHGLLHGAYAYLAVTDFWWVEADRLGPRAGRTARFEALRWRETVSRTVSALLRSDCLTPLGRRFLTGMRTRVESWPDLGPDPVERLARDAVRDHYLGWRLRHLQVDSVAVDRLVAAWLDGQSPPTHQVPTAVRQSGRYHLAANGRQYLTRKLLSDPQHLGQVAAQTPDAAYLSGDHSAAAAGYHQAIREAPEDVSAWTGLALLAWHRPESALRSAPELVAAVYRRLADQGREPADVAELDRWLAAVPARTVDW